MRTATPATGKRSRQPLLRPRASESGPLLRPRASEGRPLLRASVSQAAPIPPPPKTVASAPAALPPTAFSRISNRNTTAFKIPRNPMKIKAASLSNRNTNPLSANSAPSNRHTVQAAPHNMDRAPRVTIHESQITQKAVSNRQWQILEFNVTRRKQTTAPRSNRQYLRVWKLAIRSHQPTCPAAFCDRAR
jgi:hypothetical protein